MTEIVQDDLISQLASPARPAARGKAKAKASKTQVQATLIDEATENTSPAVGGSGAGAPGESAGPEFQEIDKLQEHGINAADLKKLKEAGLYSAFAVTYTTRKELCNIKGLSEQKVEKILEAARKLCDVGFMSGLDYMRMKAVSRFQLSTGAPKIDQLLGGGFESGSTVELFGEFRCGKTQICHAVSVIAQLPASMGGANGKVCYIDTEGTFRADRIITIAQHYNLDSNQVLENITVARCFTHDTLASCLTQVAAKFAEERYALLIVDSIMAPFRVDFSGRGELAERQQHLGKVMSRLQKLSEEFNLVVLLTNQVMADPAAAMSFAANPPKPIGGHILAHFSQLRLALRKGRAEQRIMKIYDSPNLPEGDAVFEICDKGIQDAKE